MKKLRVVQIQWEAIVPVLCDDEEMRDVVEEAAQELFDSNRVESFILYSIEEEAGRWADYYPWGPDEDITCKEYLEQYKEWKKQKELDEEMKKKQLKLFGE